MALVTWHLSCIFKVAAIVSAGGLVMCSLLSPDMTAFSPSFRTPSPSAVTEYSPPPLSFYLSSQRKGWIGTRTPAVEGGMDGEGRMAFLREHISNFKVVEII